MNAKIVRDPKIMVGKPTIAGTRVTVDFILNLVENGQTIDDIAREYDLAEDQVKAAIQYAKRGLEQVFPAQTVIAHEIFIRRKHK